MRRDEIPVDEMTPREREAYDRGFAHGTRDREDGRGRVIAAFSWSSEHEHGRIERRGYRDAYPEEQ